MAISTAWSIRPINVRYTRLSPPSVRHTSTAVFTPPPKYTEATGAAIPTASTSKRGKTTFSSDGVPFLPRHQAMPMRTAATRPLSQYQKPPKKIPEMR